MQNSSIIRPRTIKLIARLLKPWTDEGIILVSEEKEIIANLKYLSEKKMLMPPIAPKLIDQREAAEMLGLGHSNFKKLEKEGAFPFQRRMVGSAVRYRNVDVIQYLMAEEDAPTD